MYDTVPLAAADVRPLRLNAPSAHPLDGHPLAVHVGVVRGGELVGAASALPVHPDQWRCDRFVLVGPFGEAGDVLVGAVLERLRPGATLCADSARPGLLADGGEWTARASSDGRPIANVDLPAHIRARPGMYVGSTGSGGAFHLALEVLNNALDEHLAGHASTLRIEQGPDGAVTVADDGRGILPDVLMEACGRLHARGTLDGHWPHVHLSAGRLGLVVVNALSSWMTVETLRDGVFTQAMFARGEVVVPPTPIGPTSAHGTTVRFRPDPLLFTEAPPDLRPAVERAAYLAPGLHVTLNGEDLSRPGGLADLVRSWADDGGRTEPHVREAHDDVRSVRLAWSPWGGGPVRMWVNFAPVRGGSTLDAVRREHPEAALAIDVRHRDPTFDGRSRSSISDPQLTRMILALLAEP